jgi:hypothetical protein
MSSKKAFINQEYHDEKKKEGHNGDNASRGRYGQPPTTILSSIFVP